MLKNQFFAGILNVNDENSRIRIQDPGRHGSADPDPPQNVMDPQHWLKCLNYLMRIREKIWIRDGKNIRINIPDLQQWNKHYASATLEYSSTTVRRYRTNVTDPYHMHKSVLKKSTYPDYFLFQFSFVNLCPLDFLI